MEHLRSIMLAIYILLSVLIIASNLFIIFLILYSPTLRKLTRSHTIVSIALADLLLGSFVTPMVATTLIESSVADCHTHLAVQLIGDHGIFFVVGWELVTFNLVHIRETNVRFNCKFPRLPASPCLKSALLACWPWFAALCILVPLIVSFTPIKLVYSLSDDVMCMMRLPTKVLITLCFFSLYLPFYLCVAGLVIIFVCYSRDCHVEEAHANLQDESNENTRYVERRSVENPLVASIPNIVYLVCYMPLIVHTWLHFSEIHTPETTYGIIVFGLLARSVFLPLSWLGFRDIRQEVKQCEMRIKSSFSLCVSNPQPSTSSTVFFSRLQENQTL